MSITPTLQPPCPILRHKIVPFVSLHHFVHPIWFEHLGGFQKEENIAHFVDYAKLTFRCFHLSMFGERGGQPSMDTKVWRS